MKKDKKKVLAIIILLVFLLSSLAIIPFLRYSSPSGYNSQTDMEIIYIGWNIEGKISNYTKYGVPANSSIVSIISGLFGQVQLDSGKINCVGNLCNNFFTKKSWQLFLNEKEEVTNLYQPIKEGDKLFLYYGVPIELFNITLWIDYGNITYNRTVGVWKGTRIIDLLHQFGATTDSNGTLLCIFGECNKENSTWTVLLDNNSVGFDYVLEKGDTIKFVYK